MDKELKRLEKQWCDKLLNMKVKSFSISDKGDLKEIETFTDVWAREGASDVNLEKGHLRFHSFEYEADVGQVMASLDAYKTIKLTNIEFKY